MTAYHADFVQVAQLYKYYTFLVPGNKPMVSRIILLYLPASIVMAIQH